MRTSATYMFDKAENCAAVSLELEENSATIEFRGDESGKNIRKHYIRISGLNSKVCKELAKQLSKAGTFLARREAKEESVVDESFSLDVRGFLASLTNTKAEAWRETKGVSSGAIDYWYVHRSRGTLVWVCLDDKALAVTVQTSLTKVQSDGPETLFHCSDIFKHEAVKPFISR